MVRERVGDWRLAWRFALAGLVAGLLVITLAQTGVTAGTFDAGQDTLFPAPSPDPQITFVALDSRSQRTLGAFPWNNSYHAQVINYLAGLHPKVILFDIVLDHLTGNSVEPPFEATDPPLTQAIRAAAIVLAATFSLGARYVLEERERRKVERIFGHYIDPRVARQLAATRSVEDLISKGERRDLTVLFMDIRGFTSMSESMRADDVLAVIQDYLDEMSKLILKWDGLIDKYVGDEIMALWNVPLEQANHALLAIRCAYDLVSNAPALQAKLATRGLPPIGWGIGVNTGPAVVGNMGSQDRLQYTALGDTVNTGARFCSAAPAFEVLIGLATYQACSDYIAVDEVPGIQLKGKSAEKFRIFKVTAIREEPGSPWVPMPTDAAASAYSASQQLYARQSLFI